MTSAQLSEHAIRTTQELDAEVDNVLAIYQASPDRESSVESGSRWRILSAVFRRLNDFSQLVQLRNHLADTMILYGVPSADLSDRVDLYHDLGLIQDCILEQKRDVCRLCGSMEGLHRLGQYCRDQNLMSRGLTVQVSQTFAR